jgi:asparagine synthase (glutamine-hydrolysing)
MGSKWYHLVQSCLRLLIHKAPNAREFHEENVRKLGKLHMYDCLRANKSLAAWELKDVPF